MFINDLTGLFTVEWVTCDCTELSQTQTQNEWFIRSMEKSTVPSGWKLCAGDAGDSTNAAEIKEKYRVIEWRKYGARVSRAL